MSGLEALAAALGIANTFLIIRRSVWNFPVAIVMVVLFAWIFWDAKLYSDATLQLFFVAANFYGWIVWVRSKGKEGDLAVRRMNNSARVAWITGGLIATFGWGFLMSAQTDAAFPYWDASILILSIAAQIIMAQRFIDHWHWWIVVNLLSIPLYLVKGLNITAVLYTVFLTMAFAGLSEWRKVEARQ